MSHNLSAFNNLLPGDHVVLNYDDETLSTRSGVWRQRHKERHVCIVTQLVGGGTGYVTVYDTVAGEDYSTKAENLQRLYPWATQPIPDGLRVKP